MAKQAYIYDGAVWQPITAGFDTSPVGIISPYGGIVPPNGWLSCNGGTVSRTTYPDLFNILNPVIGTATIAISAAALVTCNDHGMITGDVFYFTTTGALPTGLTANTRYAAIYVSANTFRVATSVTNALLNSSITTSGTQSGTHTVVRSPYGNGDLSTTFTLPDLRGRVPAGTEATPSRVTYAEVGFVATQGNSGGTQAVILTEAEMPSHQHTWQYYDAVDNTGDGANAGARWDNSAATAEELKTITTQVTGSDASHNNMQPTLFVNYIIKY